MMLKELKSWINRENKSGTPLWKALLLERRMPWRYHFKLIAAMKYFGFNPNTKRYWDERFKSRDSWGEKHYNIVIQFLPKDKNFSLLDVGCALGEGCALIKRNFRRAKIEGCDFSTIAIEKAKKKKKSIGFFVLDITKQEIPKKYNYITLFSVVEHLRKPKEVVRKCLGKANTIIINSPYDEKNLHPEHLFRCKKDTFKEFDPKIKIDWGRITYIINNKKC